VTPSTTGLPIKLFRTPTAFEKWLATNHAKSAGLWLRLAKKGKGLTSLSFKEAIEVALCWGWIDSQAKPYDDASWLQRFTPRGPRSVWSKINTGKVAELIASGRMQPPGLAAVERAKADGRWAAAYEPASSASVPADLQAALDANPKAKAFFETLRGSNRYAVLYRIHSAKKPETRAKRVADFVAMLARHETVYGSPTAKPKRMTGERKK
jgi:uncharacterized protein YdeI (YjbR/CyaY-like superfamily)